MEDYDKVVGVFRPRVTGDLKPWAAALVGKDILWQAYWRIEEGPYAGEWAMVPKEPDGFYRLPGTYGWVPSGDIEPVNQSTPPATPCCRPPDRSDSAHE